MQSAQSCWLHFLLSYNAITYLESVLTIRLFLQFNKISYKKAYEGLFYKRISGRQAGF
jgi:hypothetical protein